MHHKTLLPSSTRKQRSPFSMGTFHKQFCVVQAESQRQSRIPSDAPASAGCTAAPLDNELIESIIFQQHLRAACVPVTAEEDDKVRCLVRWPSGRSSIDEPSPRKECMWHTPTTMHEVSPRSSRVRSQQVKFSA